METSSATPLVFFSLFILASQFLSHTLDFNTELMLLPLFGLFPVMMICMELGL